MDITYVTAFLVRSTSKHSITEYRTHFDTLAATGIPMVLFLDRTLSWSFPANVFIVPISLEDTWVYQSVPSSVMLPRNRGPVDTREYMMIQISKTEFVFRALDHNPYKTKWFAWIDFGICHVFRTPETIDRIRSLIPPDVPCIRTAGIWNWTPDDLFEQVCWRFAGGFFLLHQDYVQSFHEAVKDSVLRNLPKLAWEVNIWADVERCGLDLGWFQADHDDTIIPFTPL